MCGIAGIFNCREAPAPARGVLEAMAQALRHRGPDDQGVRVGESWGLASRRLAIIGIATGHQPLGNENGTVWVAFNGEIYNHRRLREELQGQGHAFSTETDTEVLVHLYEQHGRDMLRRLEGMFAFAIVDAAARRLLLARDRLGQKPLYYHVSDSGTVAFASELEALLKGPVTPGELNAQAVHDYLSLTYIPAPDTIYRDVAKLPPACSVEFARGDSAAPPPERYWAPGHEPKSSISFQDASVRLRELLEQAVAKRLESEVPLGAFLSGGIDSSIVVAIMQRLVSARVRTFTIGFDDPRYDEREFALAAAKHADTDHRVKVSEPRDVGVLRALIRRHGEPFCDSSMLPTALLSAFTREHVTVALSGDGGDEVFGGYQRYQVMALQRYLQAAPGKWRRALCDLILKALPCAGAPRTAFGALRRLLLVFRDNDAASFMTFQEVFSEAAKRDLYGRDAAASQVVPTLGSWESVLARGTATDFVERFMELDLLTYLPSDILCKVDIASMMHSLEVRCPFLDHELVEFAAALPRPFKASLFGRKRLLLHCARDLLPDALRRRGKRGFGVPVSQWLRGELREMVTATADTDEWAPCGFFDRSAVQRLTDEHLSGARDHGFRLWALLCYRLWCEEVGAAHVGRKGARHG